MLLKSYLTYGPFLKNLILSVPIVLLAGVVSVRLSLLKSCYHCLLFSSQSRKPRSNYRRPSSLGLSKNPLPDKTEAKAQYEAKPASRYVNFQSGKP